MRYLPILFLSLFLHAGQAHGEDSPTVVTNATETKEANGIAREEKSVPVPSPKADKAIAGRLHRILALTTWFENLNVTSQEGVVTVSGKVATVGQRDWALDLANDADGVVAVINKIELKEMAWFDMTSTKKELKDLWTSFFKFIPRLIVGLVILVASIFLFILCSRYSRRFWGHHITNPVLSDVIGKIGALPVLLIGLYLMLQVLGLTGLAFTLLGGTGALGLVAGFAFKNILENYFSGIMISLRKPFAVGDMIEVAGEKGIVFKMTTRGTTLVDPNGKHILIPNSTIFVSIIRNWTAGNLTRIHMTFEAKPESLEDQKQELKSYLLARADIVKSPELEMFVGGTAEKPKIDAYFWIDAKQTSAEKLEGSIKSYISLKHGGLKPAAVSASTKSDVQSVLARAKEASPPDPKEQHL